MCFALLSGHLRGFCVRVTGFAAALFGFLAAGLTAVRSTSANGSDASSRMSLPCASCCGRGEGVGTPWSDDELETFVLLAKVAGFGVSARGGWLGFKVADGLGFAT